MKILLTILLSIGAVLTLLACHFGDDSLNWTEDVLLPDGRIVLVTRHQEFKGPHELGDSPTPSDNWFEFKHPDTREVVRWQSELKVGEQVPFSNTLPDLRPDYHLGLAAVTLIMDAKTPLLLVAPSWGGSPYLYNCPYPGYLLYRWEAGSKWRLVPLDQLPLKRFRANMTIVDSSDRSIIAASKFHLSVEQTSSQTGPMGLPYIVNFALMQGPQNFKKSNCNGPSDLLIEPYRRTLP